MSKKEQPLLSSLVWAEYVCYAALNAVTNINTVLSLSSQCVYFSPRRTLPRVLNFCMQTYIDPKRCRLQKKLGATHPKKLICSVQKYLEPKKFGSKMLWGQNYFRGSKKNWGLTILETNCWRSKLEGQIFLGVLRVLMFSVKRENLPYMEDVPKHYCFTSVKRDNSYFSAILNSALVTSLPFTTIRHRSAWIPPFFVFLLKRLIK